MSHQFPHNWISSSTVGFVLGTPDDCFGLNCISIFVTFVKVHANISFQGGYTYGPATGVYYESETFQFFMMKRFLTVKPF